MLYRQWYSSALSLRVRLWHTLVSRIHAVSREGKRAIHARCFPIGTGDTWMHLYSLSVACILVNDNGDRRASAEYRQKGIFRWTNSKRGWELWRRKRPSWK